MEDDIAKTHEVLPLMNALESILEYSEMGIFRGIVCNLLCLSLCQFVTLWGKLNFSAAV